MVKKIVALAGPTRSGKTTFANACSKACGWPVIDLVSPIKALMSSLSGMPLPDGFKEQDCLLDFTINGYESQYSGNGREMLTRLCAAIEVDFGSTAAWCALALAKHADSPGIIVSNVYRQEQFDYLASHCEFIELLELTGPNNDCSFRSAINCRHKISYSFSSAKEAEIMGLKCGTELRWLERYEMKA